MRKVKSPMPKVDFLFRPSILNFELWTLDLKLGTERICLQYNHRLPVPSAPGRSCPDTRPEANEDLWHIPETDHWSRANTAGLTNDFLLLAASRICPSCDFPSADESAAYRQVHPSCDL